MLLIICHEQVVSKVPYVALLPGLPIRLHEKIRYDHFCLKNVFHMSSFLLEQRNRMRWSRKNQTLQEIDRIILNEYGLPKHFLATSINTVRYVINRVYLRSKLNKSSCKLYYCKSFNIAHLHIFAASIIYYTWKTLLENLIVK